jgi:hypothetical protein
MIYICMCVCVCVTPEPSTKRRMSVGRGGAAGAHQSLTADDGPGGRAASALMTMCATAVAASGGHPLVKWVGVAIAITYVFW